MSEPYPALVVDLLRGLDREEDKPIADIFVAGVGWVDWIVEVDSVDKGVLILSLHKQHSESHYDFGCYASDVKAVRWRKK